MKNNLVHSRCCASNSSTLQPEYCNMMIVITIVMTKTIEDDNHADLYDDNEYNCDDDNIDERSP